MQQDDSVSRALKLSLLEVADSETLKKEVEQVLAFVTKVQELKGVTDETKADTVLFREDKVTVTPGSYTEQALAQAPRRHKNWFVTKKILP